ncbi:hypothetical protein ACHAW5_005122 [Stephanodiscus triporus]|uniref:AB hydrolase-1 domain-containing protein n=1 Tax=Stephanodiscus triporus TaxID=2934178 RepID=A0ABD3MNG3_9STRA
MSYLPVPIARLGIRVLKSELLHCSANRMSYYDGGKVAREDGMLSFMRKGGFRPREKVPRIGVPTLVLWGWQDGLLDGEEYANMFVNGMPDATLRWIEECRHVPHLEQPERTALCARQQLRWLRQHRYERNDNNGDSVDHRRNNNYYGGGHP